MLLTHKLICTFCKREFSRTSNYKKRNNPFCSRKCSSSYTQTKLEVSCHLCGEKFYRRPSEIKANTFCSKSCATTFNNTKKRKSRRSRCEKILFDLLKEEFQSLEIIPNDKTLLPGYEVDIAIPSIKLAIEWNGIVHFKPIYGQNKLNRIQERDKEKLALANQNHINLIVVPDLVSKEHYVKEAFLQIKKHITEIISLG